VIKLCCFILKIIEKRIQRREVFLFITFWFPVDAVIREIVSPEHLDLSIVLNSLRHLCHKFRKSSDFTCKMLREGP